MDLTEAEIQVLASIYRIDKEGNRADRAAVEKRGERYWVFKEDWSDAFDGLTGKGLIGGDDSDYTL